MMISPGSRPASLHESLYASISFGALFGSPSVQIPSASRPEPRRSLVEGREVHRRPALGARVEHRAGRAEVLAVEVDGVAVEETRDDRERLFCPLELLLGRRPAHARGDLVHRLAGA